MTHLWGPSTWNLLHNLADKVREDKFDIIIPYVWSEIKTICANLPCKDCSNHAIKILSIIKIKDITNKELFKELIFKFHNTVNVRLKKEKEKIIILEKYKDIKLLETIFYVIKNWTIVMNNMSIHQFQDKTRISKSLENMKLWFRKNKHFFIDFE